MDTLASWADIAAKSAESRVMTARVRFGHAAMVAVDAADTG